MDVLTSARLIGQHSDEEKALAFQVYAVRANRDMPKTIELLGQMSIPKIPEKTIYDWRTRYQWDRRIDLESAERQRQLVNLHVGSLRVAAPDAVKYLRDVINDKAEPHPQKIAAARTLIAENRSLIVAAVNAGLLEPDGDTGEWSPAALENMSTAELIALTLSEQDAS